MDLTRTILVSMIALVFLLIVGLSAQVATAAPGGGGGGGGGSVGGGGTDLNKVFKAGSTLLAEGECKKAERKFRLVLKTARRNPEANYFQGVAQQCQDKHKRATRSLKKAVKYDKKLYAAYEKLGRSYLALDKGEEAQAQLDHLQAFIDTCGESCPRQLREAHAKLQAVIKKSEAEKAEGGTETSSSANSTGSLSSNMPIRANSARQTKPASSHDQHGLLFEKVAQPGAVYLSAVRLINLELFEEAILELGRLTATMGPHADVLNYLGYAHRRLGEWDRAEGYYEQALAIDPLHRGANEYLGEMRVEQGRLGDARRRLVVLDEACPFGCAEFEDLKRLIESRIVATK